MPRIRLLIALVLASCTLFPAAAASGSTVWIVRDGFYAGLHQGSFGFAYFHVKNRRVYHLRFALNLTCHNSNTGEDYPRTFDAGPRMPQGRLIPANGIVTIGWSERGGGREGSITGELSLRRHLLASFSVVADGGYEACEGFSAIVVERSPRTPPLPTNP
jgi:hypothetical protein